MIKGLERIEAQEAVDKKRCSECWGRLIMKINKDDYDLCDVECSNCGDKVSGFVSLYWIEQGSLERRVEMREVKKSYPQWDKEKKVKRTEAESLRELGYY